MSVDESLQQRFEQCIDRNADSLYRVAFRLTGNRESASELVQETCLQAWRGLDSIRDKSKIRGWVFGILRNQYLKLLRTLKKTPQSSSEMMDVVEQVSPNTESLENVDTVQFALSQLDDIHRLPVLLVSMEQMSVDEAANILELPRGTVLSRLHRGRQKLKEIISREFDRFEH